MTWDEEAVDKMSEDMKVMRRQQMCMGLKEFPGVRTILVFLLELNVFSIWFSK